MDGVDEGDLLLAVGIGDNGELGEGRVAEGCRVQLDEILNVDSSETGIVRTMELWKRTWELVVYAGHVVPRAENTSSQ